MTRIDMFLCGVVVGIILSTVVVALLQWVYRYG